jgi:uncharacterized membrane protein YqjE
MLSEQAGRLASTLLALVETRLELAAVELREEQQRFVAVLVLAALAVGLGLLALVAATTGVVQALAPQDRARGWLIAAGVYAAACLVLWLVVRWRLSRRPPPFAQTRAELERDRQCL